MQLNAEGHQMLLNYSHVPFLVKPFILPIPSVERLYESSIDVTYPTPTMTCVVHGSCTVDQGHRWGLKLLASSESFIVVGTKRWSLDKFHWAILDLASK